MSASTFSVPPTPEPSRLIRLLRDKTTLLYYLHGAWNKHPDQAQRFTTWNEPREIARMFPEHEMEIVVKAEAVDEVVVPITALIRLGATFKEDDNSRFEKSTPDQEKPLL